MTTFPTSLPIGTRREIVPKYATKTSRMGENQVIRYRKALFPRWEITVGWTLLSPTDAAAVDAHVLGQAAGAVPFDFIDWVVFHWQWVKIGKGDGATTIFDLPFKQTADLQLYYNAAIALAGTILPGAGADGRDRVQYTGGAPAAGVVLWANASGQRIFRVSYMRDDQPLTRELTTGYYGFETQLLGVK